MKKLYLFLFTVLCFAFVSKAQRAYTIHLTVEDTTCISVKACDYSDPTKVLETFEMKKGENTIEFTSPAEGSHLWITCDDDKVLKIHNQDGSVNYDVTNNIFKLYLSPWDSWYADPAEQWYTIKTFDADSFRPHNLKITLDKPEGIRLSLRGGEAFNTTQTEYNIPFNEEYEDLLSIRAVNSDQLIYKITANGEEVVKGDYDYTIPLVDRSDEDNIKYVTDVIITQDFPEGMMCTIKLIFPNGDPGCVSSVTYGDDTIEDWAGEDGFQVRPGKLFVANFNKDDYNIISYQENDGDVTQATWLYRVSEPISEDYTVTIIAEKYELSEGVIVPDNYKAIKVTRYDYPYTEVELSEGETTVTFKNDGNNNRLQVTPRDGFELARLYDATYDTETPISTWSTSTSIELKPGSRFEIYTKEIIRDKNVVIYVDNVDALWYGLQFSRGGTTIDGTTGYNVISYRDEDAKISVSATGASEAKIYRNGEIFEPYYVSYFSIEQPADNEVVKIFYVPDNAVEHTVTFDMVEGTLDGYEVKKDILAAVDPTEPVSAIGKTQFTIAPVSREGSDLTVTVGEENVEAVDGVYTFETEGDTTVKVTKATSGIENVICGENGTADVYNLQGIRVARQAKSADVNALPAGIYVVNGQKVIVK